MIRRFIPSLLLLSMSSLVVVSGQDGDGKLVSGPQDNTTMPGPCEVYNINGQYKDRFHCLVCDYGAVPVVMVFTHEPKPGEDEAFNALMRRLKTAMEQNKEAKLQAFVTVLSADFRSSATDNKASEREDIVTEAKARDDLLGRLRERAALVEPIVLACTTADGPKTYKINPRAEVTVVFYNKLKVVKNFAYAPGKMTQADVDAIIDRVEMTIKDTKKRPGKK